MSKFVEIYNHATGGTASVTQKAFDQVWSSLGWTLTPDSQDLPVEEEVVVYDDELFEDEESPNSDATEQEEYF